MFRRRTGPDEPLLVTPTKSPGGELRPRRQRASRLPAVFFVGAALLAVWAFATGHLIFSRSPQQRGTAAAVPRAVLPQHLQPVDKRRLPGGGWAPTLCIYVFSNTDPEYLENLKVRGSRRGQGRRAGQCASLWTNNLSGSVLPAPPTATLAPRAWPASQQATRATFPRRAVFCQVRDGG